MRNDSLRRKQMMSKTFRIFTLTLAVMAIALVNLNAELGDDTFDFVYGPRVGFTYITTDSAVFTEELNRVDYLSGRAYTPFITQFGFNVEERILLGTTKDHFAFQEVVLVGGLDQSAAIPTVGVLIGYRSESGFEFGLGPIWSLDGFSVVYAMGWTFNFQNVYVPVNLAVVPDFVSGQNHVSIYTGFNFGD
jgi:hypothetical protein